VPFVAGMVLIVPVVLELLEARLDHLAPVHLWFLEYLLIYYTTALVGVGLRNWTLRNRDLEWLDRLMASLLGVAWKPVARW